MTEKKRFHEELKAFLIELGEEKGYKSFSGDSECLDVRIKRKRIEYKPDVVWQKGNSCYSFEFAFTEDWRAVIGEFVLSWLKGCSKFFVFRFVDTEEERNSENTFFKKIFSFMGNVFDNIETKRFRSITVSFFVLTYKHTKDMNRTKREIKRKLKASKFIV
jgi:hypothetical protein